MRVLVLVDRLNWAYHSIAKAMIKYNPYDDVDLIVMPIKKNVEKVKKLYHKFDLVFVMGFQTYDKINFLSKKNTLIGIHSCHSWDDKKSIPDKIADPPKELIKFLNKFLRVNVVSKRLYDIFDINGVKKLYYTPNGVNSKIFFPQKINHDGFVVGYSGSSSHDWRKGVTKFIIPAAKKSGAKTHIAMLGKKNYVKLEEMPNFYQCLDAYICASSSEGFSLSVLEAAACGVPIITTRVSGMDELIEDGINGFFVDRTVDSIAEKINILKNDRDLCYRMSTAIKKTIEDKFCWSYRAKAWLDFIKEA